MQGFKRHRLDQNDAMHLKLSTLTIDVSESAENRVTRMISEHPVVIFSRPACYMCNVMKNLLSTIGAHPTVIELDDIEEIKALPEGGETPALYISGERVGGLENLVGLHLSGRLVPKLAEAGAL